MNTARNFFDDAKPAADLGTDVVQAIRNMSSRISSQLCTCVHCVFGRDMLRTKQNLAGDLASHMFGYLVPTKVAHDILTTFITDGVVEVFKGVTPHDKQVSEPPFDPHSPNVQHAIGQAFQAAVAHDCIQLHPGGNAPEKRHPSVDLAEKEGEEEETYSFRWRIFPKEPLRQDELVSFFNEITDRAFAAARPYFATRKLELHHRFVAPEDKRRAVPLAYDPDQEHIRLPQFLLLPTQAFSDGGFKVVDEKYVNFSAARLVGTSNGDLAEGLEHVQWHAQGLKSAQPWVYYVLGMTISLDTIVFSRVDASDWEHLALMLWDGRGCIEFIRILLGLALASGVDLGQNPDIQLGFEERTFQIDNDRNSATSDAVPSSADSRLGDGSSDDAPSTTSNSSSCLSIPSQNLVEKRQHFEIEDDDDKEDPQSKKHKMVGAI